MTIDNLDLIGNAKTDQPVTAERREDETIYKIAPAFCSMLLRGRYRRIAFKKQRVRQMYEEAKRGA